jgi:hypothetical protein
MLQNNIQYTPTSDPNHELFFILTYMNILFINWPFKEAFVTGAQGKVHTEELTEHHASTEQGFKVP